MATSRVRTPHKLSLPRLDLVVVVVVVADEQGNTRRRRRGIFAVVVVVAEAGVCSNICATMRRTDLNACHHRWPFRCSKPKACSASRSLRHESFLDSLSVSTIAIPTKQLTTIFTEPSWDVVKAKFLYYNINQQLTQLLTGIVPQPDRLPKLADQTLALDS